MNKQKEDQEQELDIGELKTYLDSSCLMDRPVTERSQRLQVGLVAKLFDVLGLYYSGSNSHKQIVFKAMIGDRRIHFTFRF